MSNILIIEDEKNLARFVELELKHEGYNAEYFFTKKMLVKFTNIKKYRAKIKEDERAEVDCYE
ncbi:hypothetical protein EfmAA290_09660 [Enterococcus faecium]|nr:hypothetical protein EfmAA290_09660 [Enterococcus faecium]